LPHIELQLVQKSVTSRQPLCVKRKVTPSAASFLTMSQVSVVPFHSG
jgi:hypothetical protein